MVGTEIVKGILVQDGCDGEIAFSMEGYATEDPEGIIDQVLECNHCGTTRLET